MKHVLLAIITLYQKTLSPDHGLLRVFFPHGACIYRPTCSQYAYDAINECGMLKGARMGAERLLRCHPFARGGYDPIQRS